MFQKYKGFTLVMKKNPALQNTHLDTSSHKITGSVVLEARTCTRANEAVYSFTFFFFLPGRNVGFFFILFSLQLFHSFTPGHLVSKTTFRLTTFVEGGGEVFDIIS